MWTKQQDGNRVRMGEAVKATRGSAELIDVVAGIIEDDNGKIIALRLNGLGSTISLNQWHIYLQTTSIKLPEDEFTVIALNFKDSTPKAYWYLFDGCWWNVRGGSGLDAESLINSLDLDKGTDVTILSSPLSLLNKHILEAWDEAFYEPYANDQREEKMFSYYDVKEMLNKVTKKG